MKTRALFIALVGLTVFSAGIVFADDASNASPAKKPEEQISPAITTHQPVSANEAPNQANNELKIVQPHNTLIPSLPKSCLPINAGQMHSLTTVGGMVTETAHKNAVINGTEMKRPR